MLKILLLLLSFESSSPIMFSALFLKIMMWHYCVLPAIPLRAQLGAQLAPGGGRGRCPVTDWQPWSVSCSPNAIWLCCHLCASYSQEKPSHLPSYTYCKVFTWWSVLWIEVIFVPIFICTVNFIMLYFVLRFYIFSCICIVWSKLYDFIWCWCILLYCILFIIFIRIV